jgi:hypothetical protein
MMFVVDRKHTYGPLWPVMGIAVTLLHVDDVRTSQETRLSASTTCCGDSVTLLYVYVGTSQGRQL